MPKQVKIEDLLRKVSDLQGIYKRMNQELLSSQKLNSSAANLINIIGKEEKTLKEITEASGLDKSTVSRQVNALVKKGYVTKTTGADKRYAYFTLSNEAETAYEEYLQAFQKLFHSSLTGWTEEEKQMLSVLLGRLNRSLTKGLK